MVDVRELKIGNYVYLQNSKTPYKITEIGYSEIEYPKYEASGISSEAVFRTYVENLNPIPLTEELLLKCGFEKHKWGVVTYTVTAYLVAYYGGLKIATMWQARFKTATLASVVAEKAHAVQLYISRAAALAYAAAQALLHKNTTRCTAALRLMRIELLKNPYTALVAVILAAGSCYLPTC